VGFVFRGIYRNGFGEGAFFVSKKEYSTQFKKLLGAEPYAGTFNIKVKEKDFGIISGLLKSGMRIHGFLENGNEFGGAMGLPARIGKLRCALILPLKTRHSSVVELISGIELRKALGIRPGARVEVTL